MDQPALLVDVDDTLLAWRQGFDRWMRSAGYQPNPSPTTAYSLYDHWLGLDGAEIERLIAEFNQLRWFGLLQPIQGALEGFQRLPRLHTVLVSACGRHPKTVALRLDNLVRLGFTFDEFIPLPLGARKLVTYAEFPPGSIVIDDSLRHCQDAVRAGHKVHMLDDWHNREGDCANITRFKHWGEFHHAA